jgi:hypothetical protein
MDRDRCRALRHARQTCLLTEREMDGGQAAAENTQRRNRLNACPTTRISSTINAI